MKVKAKQDLEVDGEKYKKGAEFDIKNPAAAHRAQRDGLVDVVVEKKAEK